MAARCLSRPNRFEIDLGAIDHNVRQVRQLVGDATKIVTALKANAYGFGLEPVARTVAAAGADVIALADLSDAVLLRERAILAPILLYPGNLIDAESVRAIQAYGFMPTVYDLDVARAYASLATDSIRVLVKVDVGLERFGVTTTQAVSVVKEVQALDMLEVHGVYVHIDVPESPRAGEYIHWQFSRYSQICNALEDAGLSISMKMAASSAVLGFSLAMRMSAVDPGHMLFGLRPPGPREVDVTLRPAFHALKSRLIHTRFIDRSEYLDMVPFAIRENMRFGVIPMGLRDGMANVNGGEVLVRGKTVSILGSPSLEHTRIDLTDVPDARVGDEVVIIGEQEGGFITADSVSEHQGFAVRAELPLAVRDSVARIYI